MLSRSAQYEPDSKISRSYPQRFDANSRTENATKTLKTCFAGEKMSAILSLTFDPQNNLLRQNK